MRKLSIIVMLVLLGLSGYGQAASVVIEEYFFPETQSGYFGIKNVGSDAIVAFAVANDTVHGVDGTHELYRKWAAGIVTESNWNADRLVFQQAISQVVPNFSIPEFGTLFPGYQKAAIYWAHDLLGPAQQSIVAGLHWEPGTLNLRNPITESCACYFSQAIPAGADATYSAAGLLGFYFYATSHSSPFVALTDQFGLIQGEAVLTPVPEPMSSILMLVGLYLVALRTIRASASYPHA